jgi:hypothetical protein
MAGRDKSKDGGAISFQPFLRFILMTLGMALALLLTLLPVILLGGWLFYGLKRKALLRKIKGYEVDFWLSEEEKASFRQAASALENSIDQLEAAHAEGRDLRKNIDGSYDRRGRGAKVQSIVDEYEPAFRAHRMKCQEYSRLPLVRWKRFQRFLGRATGCKVGFIFWLVAANIACWSFPPTLLSGWRTLFTLPMMIFRWETHIYDWKVVLFAAVGGLVGYSAGSFYTGARAKKFTPIPPLVTLENLDRF